MNGTSNSAGLRVLTIHFIVVALGVGFLAGPPVRAAAGGPAPRAERPPGSATPRGAAKADSQHASPSPARPESAPLLDLTSLEKRLRETKAIGVFTKILLKNQVDDLLEQFRAFHQGQGGATLAGLRQRYELLVLKVLSLLQDSDPVLARDISASREALWTLLTDPARLADL